MPGLVTLQQPGGFKFKDRRLHRVDRGKHPSDRASDRARPGIGVIRQQARMALGNMEDDRPCLEQGEIAFFISRILAEGMKRQMAGSFIARNETRRTS
jgi:hypothetical protein